MGAEAMRYFLGVFFLLAFLPACAIGAIPLQYQVKMSGSTQSPTHPLAGASLKLALAWDASSLASITHNSGVVEWPATNTVGVLTVSGSAASDGEYDATFLSGQTLGWTIVDNYQGVEDWIGLPAMKFEIGNQTLSFGKLTAAFAASFFSGPSPIFPKPFASDQASWHTASLGASSGSKITATNISGYSTLVPEPAAMNMLATAAACIAAAVRRHRH